MLSEMRRKRKLKATTEEKTEMFKVGGSKWIKCDGDDEYISHSIAASNQLSVSRAKTVNLNGQKSIVSLSLNRSQ